MLVAVLLNKKLSLVSYRRMTARRTVSVEFLSAAAQLFVNMTFVEACSR